MSEWTKEPWEVIEADDEQMIGNWAYASHLIVTVDKAIHEGSSHAVVAVVPWIEHLVFDKIGKSDANAARIVACVNALAGIPTDKLAQHVAAVERLREAAENALPSLEGFVLFMPSNSVAEKRAIKVKDKLAAALAAMEGGK